MKPKTLTVYYAHPMALYDSPVERKDLRTLKKLGFKVVNPAKRELDTMEDYVNLACSCDLVAFRAFEDGKVGSGVFIEVAAAMKADIPVIELTPFLPGRVLTRNETRERMCLPPLRHPKTAPLRTVRDWLDDHQGDYEDQEWGNS
jgi:hypothetical protein